MHDGIGFLRAAAKRLENQSQLRREEIAHAINDFGNAMLHGKQIPKELLESGEKIQSWIALKGPMNSTLSSLTDVEVWHIADLIWNFAARVEMLLDEV